MSEKVNHPEHYNRHPSGIEAIDICEHMCFNLGNAFKYLFRYHLKGGVQDIHKAIWYLNRQRTLKEIPILSENIYAGSPIRMKMKEFLKCEDNIKAYNVFQLIFRCQFYGGHSEDLERAVDYLQQILREVERRNEQLC